MIVSNTGMQCDSLHGFPDDTLDLLVSDLSEVRFLVGDGCLQLDRIRHPLGHVLISFDSLQPAAVLVSQPERDASGMQIMLRRVEVDSSQLLFAEASAISRRDSVQWPDQSRSDGRPFLTRFGNCRCDLWLSALTRIVSVAVCRASIPAAP